MSDFFSKRLAGYEEHMSVWEKSYKLFAELLPFKCREILDLGCGTGLELDHIWQKDPEIEVTGVDFYAKVCWTNFWKNILTSKHLITVCQDYFQYNLGCGKWDAIISFESLHHFLPECYAAFSYYR